MYTFRGYKCIRRHIHFFHLHSSPICDLVFRWTRTFHEEDYCKPLKSYRDNQIVTLTLLLDFYHGSGVSYYDEWEKIAATVWHYLAFKSHVYCTIALADTSQHRSNRISTVVMSVL